MAQQGAQRGPMATFDALLQAYLDYLALADDAARAAFLRERVGFKASPGETFKDGPAPSKSTLSGWLAQRLLTHLLPTTPICICTVP